MKVYFLAWESCADNKFPNVYADISLWLHFFAILNQSPVIGFLKSDSIKWRLISQAQENYTTHCNCLNVLHDCMHNTLTLTHQHTCNAVAAQQQCIKKQCDVHLKWKLSHFERWNGQIYLVCICNIFIPVKV